MTMKFKPVVETLIQQFETGQLPDQKAHQLLAPYQRLSREEALRSNPNPKLGAVLVLLYPNQNGLAHTVLMERNAYNGVHSKQISFPGGKCEPKDHSFEFTALREAEEEVGLTIGDASIIGKLSDVYIPPSGFLVKPFVAVCKTQPHFTADIREVKSILEAPLTLFTKEKAVLTRSIPIKNPPVSINAPYFDVFGHVVWGATAMILGELRYLLNQAKHEV